MVAKLAVSLTVTKLRIATRNSPLALWQARHVAELLQKTKPSVEIALVSTDTFGDLRLDKPISELGGKGAFSKEIQQLVLDGNADIAVHSAKDLQAHTPEGLSIAAFTERGEPSDALIGCSLEQLPIGAKVATGSGRRRALLRSLRPDLELHELRGNIGTRIAKLEHFDAIVMATVAIERLRTQFVPPEAGERDSGDAGPIGESPFPPVHPLPVESFVPQVGQAALAVEVLAANSAVAEIVAEINHKPTEIVVSAERLFLVELGADCNFPAGAHAVLVGDQVEISGVLADHNEQNLQRAQELGSPSSEPGRTLARRLQKQLDASP